ncbi:Metallo-dependent phosphatase [Canariomyces notabilis]|uniref:Metallo-dependent phosphatase n=1 Tax=Canariomyces notabilis TaxID=2074819 RepID=A0AAN6YUV8_9PEZI|nr:Metallo-dependent phosphatase [Canariomyces arenarius]
MTRRIVRTIVQTTTAALFTFIVLFFLDRNFRVLPNAIHEYLPTHHAGLVITDVALRQCSTLNVFSSCKLDPAVWHRIDKDLYLGKGLFSSAYLHVQHKREEELTADDKVVIDLAVGRLNPGANEKGGKGQEKWEARPAGLWIKRSNKRGASDSKNAVTAVDVLFGDDAVEARPGWAITGTPLLLDTGSNVPAAHITIRRGVAQEPVKPVLRIGENGRFKIMQLADLHLSTGVGHCRDALPEDWNGGKCEADPRTLDFVAKMLEEERPNLVVLSGDQVNGDTAPDAQSAIFKYAQLLIKHKIPYVSIFGNHDDEGSMSRAAQMELIETLPYSLSRAGPAEIDGVGNYYIEVLARGGSGHSAITVYLLDTHAYSPNERKFPGYDWIKKNQIDWFRSTAQGLKKKHKEYTHMHMDVAFIHIPLPEYRDADIPRVGAWLEPSTAPVYNSGFHDALVDEGVVMVSCGHDHVNEFCGLSTTAEGKPALWMCHAGAAGFGGYAGYGGFHRKIRVFDFDMNEARITTWKRVEWGPDVDKKIDEQILVDAGKPVFPEQE